MRSGSKPSIYEYVHANFLLFSHNKEANSSFSLPKNDYARCMMCGLTLVPIFSSCVGSIRTDDHSKK